MHPSFTKEKRLEPQGGCGISGIVAGAQGLENAVLCIHGPVSCSSGYRMIPLFADKEPVVPTTALTEKDLVLGSVERLENALIQLHSLYSPQLIIVVLTCALSLTGEPLEYKVRELTRSLPCPILLCDGSGLEGDAEEGFAILYEALKETFQWKHNAGGELLALDGLSETDWSGKEDGAVLKELLSEHLNQRTGPGLFLQFNIERDAPMYAGSISLPLGHLWQHATPSPVPAPYGIQGTFRWLEHVAEYLGKPLPEKAEVVYKGMEEKFRNTKRYHSLQNTGVLVAGSSWWAVGLSIFLKEELGMNILLSTDTKGTQYFQDRLGEKDIVLEDCDGYELLYLARDFKPRFVFASSYLRDPQWTWIPFQQPVWQPLESISYMGYKGAFDLLDFLLEEGGSSL